MSGGTIAIAVPIVILMVGLARLALYVRRVRLPKDPARGEWRVWWTEPAPARYDPYNQDVGYWCWQISLGGETEDGRVRGGRHSERARGDAFHDAGKALHAMRVRQAAAAKITALATNITELCPNCHDKRRTPGALSCESTECRRAIAAIQDSLNKGTGP